jgi:hypothetical protein
MKHINVVLLGFVLGGGCGGGKAMSKRMPTSTVITTNAEAHAALGKLVQVTGTVDREKLGDTVNRGDLSVRCPDFRFPDVSVNKVATAEGTLEIVADEAVTVSPTGEHSQGFDVESSTFVLRHCAARP